MKIDTPTKTDRFMQIVVMGFFTFLYTSTSVILALSIDSLNEAFVEAPISTSAGMAAAIVIGLNLTAKRIFNEPSTNNELED